MLICSRSSWCGGSFLPPGSCDQLTRRQSAMTADHMILLQFSMHCFKIIFIYCICVNVLEHLVQRVQDS